MIAAVLVGIRVYLKWNTGKITKAYYVESVDENKITLDDVEILYEEDARKAAVSAGWCTQFNADNHNCLPNGDIFFENKSVDPVIYNLSKDLVIILTSSFVESSDGIAKISINKFIEYIGKMHQEDGQKIYQPFEIALDSKGDIVLIKEIFRP